MGDALTAFLADREPVATESVVWGEQMRLQAAAYLTSDPPPLPYVTSVRAIVLHKGCVLVQQDRDSQHILPGGRREEGESLEVTLRREVAEETGWSLGPVTLLGFTHFRHVDPKPPGYAYPYPDFCWVVYVAEAAHFAAGAKVDDGYEVGTEFLQREAARALPLTPCQQVFLDAAVR
jgi:8-oxo-dGTP pyrophosphatase MutT (NUDIX family)